MDLNTSNLDPTFMMRLVKCCCRAKNVSHMRKKFKTCVLCFIQQWNREKHFYIAHQLFFCLSRIAFNFKRSLCYYVCSPVTLHCNFLERLFVEVTAQVRITLWKSWMHQFTWARLRGTWLKQLKNMVLHHRSCWPRKKALGSVIFNSNQAASNMVFVVLSRNIAITQWDIVAGILQFQCFRA